MGIRILDSFWNRKKLSVALVEQKDPARERKVFLAFVSTKTTPPGVWAIPGNRILRAIELVKMARDDELTIEGVQKLWREMSRDELDSSLTAVQIMVLIEWLIESGIHPSLDEIREYCLEVDSPDKAIVQFLESSMRNGLSAKILETATLIESGKIERGRAKKTFQILTT
jgi:hypothetical protein